MWDLALTLWTAGTCVTLGWIAVGHVLLTWDSVEQEVIENERG
jgi:hypothetical protein